MPEPNHILVSHKGRELAFLFPCKSANTTIKLALYELIHGGPAPENVHALGHFEYVSTEFIAHQPFVTKVGLIRHPVERVMSIYNYIAPPHLSFGAWIRRIAQHSDHEADQHERSQAWDLMSRGMVLPDLMLYVGGGARLEDDWLALTQILGWPLVSFGTYRNSLEENGLPRRECVELNDPDSEAWRCLYARFAADFILWEQLKPRRASSLLNRAHGMELPGLSSAQGPVSIHAGSGS